MRTLQSPVLEIVLTVGARTLGGTLLALWGVVKSKKQFYSQLIFYTKIFKHSVSCNANATVQYLIDCTVFLTTLQTLQQSSNFTKVQNESRHDHIIYNSGKQQAEF